MDKATKSLHEQQINRLNMFVDKRNNNLCESCINSELNLNSLGQFDTLTTASNYSPNQMHSN